MNKEIGSFGYFPQICKKFPKQYYLNSNIMWFSITEQIIVLYTLGPKIEDLSRTYSNSFNKWAIDWIF